MSRTYSSNKNVGDEVFQNLNMEDWWNADGKMSTLHSINPVRFEFVLEHADISGKEIIDVGCGGGLLTETLALNGAKVVGIDANQEAIDVAMEHAIKKSLAIDYKAMRLEQYLNQLYPPKFDIATCMELIEHVDDPTSLIKDLNRALDIGGMLFISTINRNLIAWAGAIIAAENVLKIVPKGTHDYKYFIKPSELANTLYQNGFKLVDIKGIKFNPINHQASLSSNVCINYIVAAKKITELTE